MFSLRPIPCPDLCDRVGCQREPDVQLDSTARLALEFRRARARLCMPCLAEAERELSEREHAARVRAAEQHHRQTAHQMRGREW